MARVIAIDDTDSPFTVPARQDDSSIITEDVIIECDVSAGAITINLPTISTFLNRVVKVADVSGNATAQNITVQGGNINQGVSVVIVVDDGSTIVTPVSRLRWEASTGNLA